MLVDQHMENWKEFIPYDDNVYIKDIDTYKDFILITSRENGTNRVRVIITKIIIMILKVLLSQYR